MMRQILPNGSGEKMLISSNKRKKKKHISSKDNKKVQIFSKDRKNLPPPPTHKFSLIVFKKDLRRKNPANFCQRAIEKTLCRKRIPSLAFQNFSCVMADNNKYLHLTEFCIKDISNNCLLCIIY